MDVVIGRIPPVRNAREGQEPGRSFVEARVLHVRPPRRQRRPPDAGEESRRRGSTEVDPPGARVLVLLVPEAHRLPPDLGEGNWRVFLRFVRR